MVTVSEVQCKVQSRRCLLSLASDSNALNGSDFRRRTPACYSQLPLGEALAVIRIGHCAQHVPEAMHVVEPSQGIKKPTGQRGCR